MKKMILAFGVSLLLGLLVGTTHSNEVSAEVLRPFRGQVVGKDCENGCLTIARCGGGNVVVSILAAGEPGTNCFPQVPLNSYIEYTTKSLPAVCNNTFLNSYTIISGC